MKNKDEQHQVYTIPQNFVDTGTFFGGMFKVRNALEAGATVILIVLTISNIPVGLTSKIIILWLSALLLVVLTSIVVAGACLCTGSMNLFVFS